MAKSRSRRRTRDLSNVAKRSLRSNGRHWSDTLPVSARRPWAARLLVRRPDLRLVEDRRTWAPVPRLHRVAKQVSGHPSYRLVPTPPRSARSLLRSPVNLPARSTRNMASPTHSISFEYPRRIVICVRRKRRQEVLHALKKTGKSGQRRPRRNPYSEVNC